MASKTVVTGVIGADGHIVGNWVLRQVLQQEGFKVVSLGASVSQRDLINAAVETKADAILVSSIYGQGAIDCDGFRAKCDEAGLKNIVLYVGGNLTPSDESDEVVESKFKAMGFNRVYPPQTHPADAIVDLKKDLGL
ncbi:MAG: methylaspartate mutase subunit S [Sterolibacterium sp.]